MAGTPAGWEATLARAEANEALRDANALQRAARVAGKAGMPGIAEVIMDLRSERMAVYDRWAASGTMAARARIAARLAGAAVAPLAPGEEVELHGK